MPAAWNMTYPEAASVAAGYCCMASLLLLTFPLILAVLLLLTSMMFRLLLLLLHFLTLILMPCCSWSPYMLLLVHCFCKRPCFCWRLHCVGGPVVAFIADVAGGHAIAAIAVY